MKKVFCLLIILMVLPLVSAKINEVEIFNNDIITSADEDGGTIETDVGDVLTFTFEDKNEENTSVNVIAKVVVDGFINGDDYVKDITYSLDGLETKTKSLKFRVHDDVTFDIFSTALIILYDNVTEDSINFDLDVSGVLESDMQAVIGNLTTICGNYLDTTRPFIENIQQNLTFVERYTNCASVKKLFESERNDCYNDLNVTQGEKNTLTSELEIVKSDRDRCNEQKLDMVYITQCEEEKKKAESDAKSSVFMMVLLIGGGIYFYMEQKKKKEAVDDEYEELEEA